MAEIYHNNQSLNYWRVSSELTNDLILFGSYNDTLQYVKEKSLANPKIIPIDFKQISNNEKNHIQKYANVISSFANNKVKTKIDSILLPPIEPCDFSLGKSQAILSKKINDFLDNEPIKKIDLNKTLKLHTKIPNLKLKNLKNMVCMKTSFDSQPSKKPLESDIGSDAESIFDIIDAKLARLLMMDSCNKKFIQKINNQIRQRATDGYTNVKIDLEELLNPGKHGRTPKNIQLEIRNLNLSWESSFNNTDYFERELNKIIQFYKNLEYELNIESNYIVISWL